MAVRDKGNTSGQLLARRSNKISPKHATNTLVCLGILLKWC